MHIPDRYLALGDSFTIGTGTTPDRAFPAVLVARWRDAGRTVALRNPAVNGYTTDDLIREELPNITSFRPTFATVLIGANDIVGDLRTGNPAPPSEHRYARQLDRIFAALAGVEIIALPQPDWSLAPMGGAFGDRGAVARTIERFNTLMREAAGRAGGRYVDLFPLMRTQGTRGMFAPDGLHPSAEAHAEWAAALASDASWVR
jgi:lysophospholipase L1-like esterase